MVSQASIRAPVRLFAKHKLLRKRTFVLHGIRPRIIVPVPEPHALDGSAFENFPKELIREIVGYLPMSSAAIFSICCRSMYWTLGYQYLQELKLESENDMLCDFVQLLESDLRNYIACVHCAKLHTIEKASNYVPRAITSERNCDSADMQYNIRRFMFSGFSQTLFAMTMKRYRQGRDCTWLLSLLTYISYPTYGHQSYETRKRRDLRIVGGRMLIRLQETWAAPDRQSLCRLDTSGEICPHISYTLKKDRDRVSSGNHTFQVQQCSYCHTEFRIRTHNPSYDCAAVTLTRWKDLGDGPTLDNQKWRSHIRDGNLMFGPGVTWSTVSFVAGSIKDEFESGSQDTSMQEDIRAIRYANARLESRSHSHSRYYWGYSTFGVPRGLAWRY
ncbi:hypothetical protein F5884DRAFT_772697 [Xylogone sp. PMI_703]|nr:hypothetical protein F5884DRAFT_772697 [Xylogone sp. PMI_703]